MQGISRRALLRQGGAGAVGAAGAAIGVGVSSRVEADGHASRTAHDLAAGVVEWRGQHQAGVATPVQDRLHLAAFDLTTESRDDLASLLRDWTRDIAALTAGRPVGDGGAVRGAPQAPPADTGEALGLPSSRLTVTVGVGPSVFALDGSDRFGLSARRPEALEPLPHFRGDQLDPARSDGDLIVQACADDPQVAVHAVRTLARTAFGRAGVRWSQLGFGKTSSTTPEAATPRNLFGFKDGTANIAHDDESALQEHIWVGDGDDTRARWLVGGTYLVARRIRMHIETWDRESLRGQERIIGRTKGEGAPLGRSREHDVVHPATLPSNSHVALAHPSSNEGRRLLRRGYSFVDGSDGLGRLDAGLVFLAFCRNPQTQFVPLQDKLSRMDALSDYLEHTASGLWAVLPGVPAGGSPTDYLGRALLEV
ncbi:MAG: iron uptake transporter deferrochelatase/peroxidase subunit [Actinomycetes bacterium]